MLLDQVQKGELWDRQRRKEVTELTVKRHVMFEMKEKVRASNHMA